MKLAILPIALMLAAGAATGHAQTKGHEHGAPPPCCDTGAATQAYKATGVVKKAEAAKSSVTLAHSPVKELNWPAMTMAFKVKNKALLDQLTVDRKVDFSFVRDGKDYVITAVSP